MIGRLHHVVIDSGEPAALARFYAELTGLPVVYESADWVVIAESDHASGIAFQLSPGHEPPRWPDPLHPQQFHLDVMVDDVDIAGAQVRALGATKLAGGDGLSYADPSGHPFCLVTRPGWASPVGP